MLRSSPSTFPGLWLDPTSPHFHTTTLDYTNSMCSLSDLGTVCGLKGPPGPPAAVHALCQPTCQRQLLLPEGLRDSETERLVGLTADSDHLMSHSQRPTGSWDRHCNTQQASTNGTEHPGDIAAIPAAATLLHTHPCKPAGRCPH